MRGSVDEHVARWREELPWMDPVKEQIVTRLFLVTRRLGGARSAALRSSGLVQWQFKTLLMLRGQGAPYELSPSGLADALGLTRGALSSRLATLEAAGLVEREHRDADRRRVTVRLTDEGSTALEAQLRTEEDAELRLLDALSARERDQLARLLRKLMDAA